MVLFASISVFVSVCMLSYTYLICSYCYHWKMEPEFVADNQTPITAISIIIPARNEEKTILECLNSLIDQNYPKDLFEIIVIDDNSTDSTISVVNNFILSNSFFHIHLLSLKDEHFKGLFKKRAITKAMTIASGSLIITTDADCIMHKNWLQTIARYYEKTSADMIIGPVAFHKEKTTFEKLQSLEFMALIGSGGAAAMANNPIMCNGANLIYKKDFFEKVGGYDQGDNNASGDDMFLMLKIKKEKSSIIHFLKSREAIVFTEAKHTIASFLNQRKRWVSKSKSFKDIGLISVAIIVYLSNFTILLCSVLGFIEIRFLLLGAILLLVKSVADYVFLKQISVFFDKGKLLRYFLPEQIIYLFYVTFIGVIGNIGKYRWKGRVQR